MIRIVAVDERFFSDHGLCSIENELVPNTDVSRNRPYVVVLKLRFRGKFYDFAIPFRSNIAGHRDKFEYFALPPRKETKSGNIHGLHFIKMFPVKKSYLIKYRFPKDNASANLTRSFIKKNLGRLVAGTKTYLEKYQADLRPQFCVDIDKLCEAISEPTEPERNCTNQVKCNDYGSNPSTAENELPLEAH